MTQPAKPLERYYITFTLPPSPGTPNPQPQTVDFDDCEPFYDAQSGLDRQGIPFTAVSRGGLSSQEMFAESEAKPP